MTKTQGMINALFPGCTPIQKAITRREGTEIYTPVDGDHSVVVKILSYSEETGIIEGVPVWDQTQSFRIFSEAKIQGRDGVPTVDQVETDNFCVCHRVGDFNSNPVGKPQGFELREKNNANVSWVSFFFDVACDAFPVPALVRGNPNVEKTTPVDGRVCNPFGFIGPFFQLDGFEVVNGNLQVFSKGGVKSDSLDTIPVLIDDSVNITRTIQARNDCDSVNDAKVFYPVLIGSAEFNGGAVYLITGESNLDYTAVCCEEPQEPDPDPGGGGGEPDPDPDPQPGEGATCPASATSVWLDQNGNVIRTITLSATQIEIDPENQQSCAYRVTRAEDPSLPADQVTINQGFYTVTNPFGAVMQARLLNPQEGENGVPLTHKGTYVVIGGRRQDQSPQDRQTVAVEVS